MQNGVMRGRFIAKDRYNLIISYLHKNHPKITFFWVILFFCIYLRIVFYLNCEHKKGAAVKHPL